MNALLLIHVAISLVGIFSGFVVLFALTGGRNPEGWTAVFLGTTVATSASGFFLPAHHLMPSHVIGILSLIVLGVAIYALYARRLAGGWRKAYVIGSIVALYFNVFVAIVQSFMKIPALKALAPTQTEPPFGITQLVVLALFIILGFRALVRFRGEPAVVAQ